MRFSGFFFSTIVVVLILNWFLPYWFVMIVLAVLAAAFKVDGGTAFFSGGLGMGLVWLGLSLYINFSSGSHLSDNMAEIMGLKSGVFLLGITAILGFLLGAFSSWTGALLHKVSKRKPDNIYRG